MKRFPLCQKHALPILMKLGFAALGCMTLLAPCQAQIIANFSGGNGTALVDQYTGTAGNGWTSAWYTVSNSGTSPSPYISGTVVSTNPLDGGGNYLSVTNSNPASTSAGDIVGRDISSANGVNLSTPYTISFEFRLDSQASSLGSSDGITIVNDSSASRVLGGANGFGIYGNSSGWQVRNGASFTSTGMALTTGVVYSFTLALDPANYHYTASIFNGSTTYTSGTLSYRNTSNSPSSFTHLLFDSKDLNGTQVAFSLDSIAVAAVPEPATSALLLGGGASILLVLRKRKS